MTNLYEIFHKNSRSQQKIINQRNFTYINIIKYLEIALKKIRGKKILDIGCGSGAISFYLSKKGYLVEGIDISKKAINVAEETAKVLHLKNVSFKRINFPNQTIEGKFDLVILSEVIEHLLNDEKALIEIHKLLTKHGILFLTTPSKNAPLYRLGFTRKFDKRVGHLRRYTIDELIKILKKNGFIIIKSFKTEGVLRNFLFINPVAGGLIKFIRLFFVDVISFLDNVSIKLFGESQLIIISKKD